MQSIYVYPPELELTSNINLTSNKSNMLDDLSWLVTISKEVNHNAIFGDSIIHGIRLNEFNHLIKNGYAKLKRFSNATSSKILHYAQTKLQGETSNALLLHVGVLLGEIYFTKEVCLVRQYEEHVRATEQTLSRTNRFSLC